MTATSVSNELQWPNEKVEPVLITFNRAAKLSRTLDLFMAVGMRGMRLHVLDNASTDATRETVASYQAKWPELCYHRNKFNIGGSANYLRALEVSDSEYCWVIGDDDDWFPERFEELAQALRERDADVIRLGWLASAESRGRKLPLDRMAAEERLFFASVGMTSAVIFRKSLFLDGMTDSYMAIGDAYPQMVPFYRRGGDATISVFTTPSDIMRHTPSSEAGYFLSDLEWIACYVRSMRFLTDISLKRKAVQELIFYLKDFLGLRGDFLLGTRILLYYSIKSKAYGFDQVPYFFTLLGYTTGAMRLQSLLALVIHQLLPNPVVRTAVRWARRRQGLPDNLDEVRGIFLKGREARR